MEVTKYVAAEEEPDDRLLDEQDEANEDLLREDMEESVSNDKKDTEDDILNDEAGDGKDLEHVEMDGEDTLDEKYDPDLAKTLDESMEEKVKYSVLWHSEGAELELINTGGMEMLSFRGIALVRFLGNPSLCLQYLAQFQTQQIYHT